MTIPFEISSELLSELLLDLSAELSARREEEEPGDAEIITPEKPIESEKPGALREPPRYSVILHNDDYTTMEFVVGVLRRFFQKSEEEAMAVMLQVHHVGRGVAGVYAFDIAETKAAQVIESARQHSYPLQCTIEEHPES